MNAPFKPEAVTDLDWAHALSPFAWSVMIYGGQNPRTGQDQPNHEAQFARTRYGTEGILWRANDFAKGEHRTHFAVRGTDGSVIYDGPVLNEIEAPRVIGLLTKDEMNTIRKGHQAFVRSGSGGAFGPGSREPSRTASGETK